MARTRDRQRALARAKLERQIARRAAAARRRRQVQAGTAAGIALVLVVLGALWFSGVFEPDKEKPAAAGDCVWTAQTGGESKDVGTPPTTDIASAGTQTMTITTDQGTVEATIDTANAPCTAASFTYLASKDFFNNTTCHRLTTSGIFVLQCGDPSATGGGGPTYRFGDENLPEPTAPSTDPSADPSASASTQTIYKGGTLAMANSGANTNGSQFFIVYQDSPLDAKYTVFGTVTKGLDVVEKVAKGGVDDSGGTSTDGKPKLTVTIQTLTMTAPTEPEPDASTDPSAPAGTGTPSPDASNPQS